MIVGALNLELRIDVTAVHVVESHRAMLRIREALLHFPRIAGGDRRVEDDES